MSVVTVPAPARGGLHVVSVLTLMQVAFLVLAGLGEVVLMGGNPAYLLLPVVKAVLLIVFATQALRRRRWALRALVVLAWITLVGFALQGLIALAPAVGFAVNLVGLMTNVGLPIAVILLCRPELRAIKQARRAARAAARVPADPYWPAPMTVPGGPPGSPVPVGYAPMGPIVYPPVVHGPPRTPLPAEPGPAASAGETTWEAPR